MERVTLALHWTGACRHPERSTRRGGGWRAVDFPMFSAVVDRSGELTVVDPGYAPRFLEATDPFPERLYRWATPARCPPASALAARLDASGGLERVRRVVVTHFHADHVAGLLDLPDVEVLCSRRAWGDLHARRGRFGVVRRGYLRSLAPAELGGRVRFIEDLPSVALPRPLDALGPGFDLFGDRSVVLVHLPGHGCGQIGALLDCGDGARRFLIGDAAWSGPALLADEPPPWLVRRLLGVPSAYMRTWARLRAAAAADPELRFVPAHCTPTATSLGAAVP
jgi:glyoxylase-like metal-dependent hydrolase (beta-lactamase superfamily II)